jgi:PhnB protein
MARKSGSGQLEERIEATLAGRKAVRHRASTKLDALARIAENLRGLPRKDFRDRLKSELEGRANMASTARMAGGTYHTVTAYLTVPDARAAIEFYKNAFGATERYHLTGPGTKIGHAEIAMGDSVIMLSDEFPEFGARSPKMLGGSPTKIKLSVDDADAVAKRAVALGAKEIRPIQDQFYGDRSGQFEDPFGYVWIISTEKEFVAPAEMQRRFDALVKAGGVGAAVGPEEQAAPFIRKGFHTITPYLIVRGAANLLKFIEEGLGGTEVFRVPRPGTPLLMHAEARIGNSMVELADANEEIPPTPTGLHLYVPDADAVYQKALEAGATSLHGMTDQEYGERSGSVKDRFGNNWYIATAQGTSYVPPGHYSVTPYLHPLRAPQFIDFLKRAFGAEEVFRAQSPEGVVNHAQVRIGDSLLSMGEAHGIYQPMPATLHLYVPNADVTYERALRAGAESILAVKDQPYGERSGGVKDAFGNRWFIATHLGDLRA